MPATTPLNPSKQKEIDKMNKTEPNEEVNYHRHNKVDLEDWIEQLQKEIHEIRVELNYMKRERNNRDRLIERAVEIEKSLAEQEQYSRRECIELAGLPEDIHREDLEAGGMDTFDVA